MAAQICVARIGAAHGVRGAVKLWTFTEDPLRREGLRPADDPRRRAPVRGDACARGKGPSGGDAERHRHPRGRRTAQRHRTLHRARKAAGDGRRRILPRRPDRACGGHCRRRAARPRAAIHNFGAGDIIEIAPPRGPTMLLPFTNAVVPTVDLADGRVVIELPQEIEGDDAPRRSRDGFGMTGAPPSSRCFRRCFPGRSASAWRARRWRPACGRWRRATSGDSASDRHRSVDDTPAGGGPGMVLRADVLAAAIDAADVGHSRPRLLMSPRGRPLTQARVAELAAGPGPLIVCGRFEGIDQRVIEAREPRGGLDRRLRAVRRRDRRDGADRRLRPAVAGRDGQTRPRATDESFSDGLLEYPQYTRPQEFEGAADPGNPDFRRPRQGRGLAAGGGRSPDPGAAAGPMGARSVQPKRAKKHDRRVTSPRRLPYTSAKSAPMAGYETFAQPALDWLGRAADGDFDEPDSTARKRAVRQTVRRPRPFRNSVPATP